MSQPRFPRQPITKRRMNGLHIAQARLLNDWAKAVREMFPDAMGVYHVGTSAMGVLWRDVDVRVILRDRDFEQLDALVRVRRLHLALSLWGQQVTGLPIDCQVQSMSFANSRYGGRRRNAIGIGSADGLEGA